MVVFVNRTHWVLIISKDKALPDIFKTFFQGIETFIALAIKQLWEIVFLCIHKLGSKISLAVAAKHIDCLKSMVHHWVKTFKMTGDTVDEPGRGGKGGQTNHPCLPQEAVSPSLQVF